MLRAGASSALMLSPCSASFTSRWSLAHGHGATSDCTAKGLPASGRSRS
ncbi:MAG: hypothetical protein U0168_04130 [Nannocystaceae bacterium]